ncbi:MAG: motility protein A [Pseudobdellovibrionaceae bacterium]
MNFSLSLGIFTAVATLYFGVFRTTANPTFYLDPHALILVCGGTLAATLIAFPIGRMIALADTFMSWFLRRKTIDHRIVEELYEVAIYYRKYNELVSSLDFSHPFIREGFEFVKSKAFNERQLEEILSKRIIGFRKTLQNDAKMLNAIAKFPPAFGLLGASTGMISMMLHLNEGGTKAIGPAMATALVATFWGIALSNLIFLPLADNASKIAADDSHTRLIILEGLVLIKMDEEPHVIVEILKSHLSPADRAKVRVFKGLSLDTSPKIKSKAG